MSGIVADHNCTGHLARLLAILDGEEWSEIWRSLRLTTYEFGSVGLDRTASDRDVWLACEREGLALLTANRNREDPDSLEAILRERGTANSLPVFTIADADRMLKDKRYAERVVERLLEYLLEIEGVRGAGRVWLP